MFEKKLGFFIKGIYFIVMVCFFFLSNLMNIISILYYMYVI